MYLPDGGWHPSYLLYMDTNWIRVAIIVGYALLALTTAVVTISRIRPAAGVPAGR